MTTTNIPDDTAGKVRRNAEIMIKSASSYVVLIAGAAAAYWLAHTPSEQAAFLLAHPVLAPLAPYAAILAFVLAKIAPQNLTLSGDRNAKIEQAIDYLIEKIRAAQAAPAANAPQVIVAPPDLLAGMKPAEVAQVKAAVSAAIAPAVDATLEPMPPAAPPMPRTATVTGPKTGDAELADALLATVQQKYPGMSAAEAIAAVQSGLVAKARAAA